MGNVHEFAAQVIELMEDIHFVVLNAATNHDESKSPDDDSEWISPSGHNRLIASNHLGHFLLMALLAPYLAVDSTVVVVCSLAAWFGNPHWLMTWWGVPPTRPAKVKKRIAGGGNLQKYRVGVRAYGTSKLANYAFATLLREKVRAR